MLTDDAKTSAISARVREEDEFHSRPRQERWSFHDALKHYIFARLVRGTVNIDAAIRALKSRNHDGWLVIEQDKTSVDLTSIADRKQVLFGERSLSRKRIAGRA